MESLENAEDGLVQLETSTVQFLDNAPVMKVTPQYLKEVDFKAFEDMQKMVLEAEERAKKTEKELEKAQAAARIAKEKADADVQKAIQEAKKKKAEAEESAKRAREAKEKQAEAERKFENDKNDLEAKA